MQQIALPLHRPEGDDPAQICVGAPNEEVIAALRAPGDWPYGTAILTGPERSGKSLLGRWFAQTADHGAGEGAQDHPREVIDNADQLDEAALFHRWNTARERDARLLLIVQSQPWEIALPDLRSRLGAAMPLEIGAIDEDMAAALLASQGERRGLMLGPDAASYLLRRIERSYGAIEQVAAEIDRLSLERKTAPGLAIWRDALDAVQGAEQPRLI